MILSANEVIFARLPLDGRTRLRGDPSRALSRLDRDWGRVREERIAVEILREENVRAAGSFRHFLRKCHLPPGGRLIRTAYLHGMSNKCRLSVFY